MPKYLVEIIDRHNVQIRHEVVYAINARDLLRRTQDWLKTQTTVFDPVHVLHSAAHKLNAGFIVTFLASRCTYSDGWICRKLRDHVPSFNVPSLIQESPPMAATTKTKPESKASEQQAKAARVDRVGDVFAWFGWKSKNPSPQISDADAADVDAFLDDCETDRLGTIMTPDAIWRFVDMPSRLLKHFGQMNNAMALASALMPDSGKYFEWIAEQGAPSEFGVAGSLADLTSETYTPNGTVFAELKGDVSTIWFGRKANQLPAFSGEAAVDAVKALFNVALASSRRDDERLEAAATKKTKAKMVAKKADDSKDAEPRTTRRSESATLNMVPLRAIQPAKENHRKVFDKAALTELADSIKAHGVLQPLLLRPLNDGPAEFFVIIAGERRYRAALQAGLKEVPAQIVEREGVSESLAMLHENIMRVDLNPIERAQAIRRLMDEHLLSQKEVGQMVGCGQGQISNELRLLNLPESLQAMVAAGKIAPTLIRVVLPWSDIAPIMEAVATKFKKRIDDGASLNVPDAECILDECVDKNSRSMHDRSKDPVSEWMKPSKDVRYFGKVDPEKLKALDVRKVKHRWGAEEERAFNIPLFHELNREPLKKRMEKYNELQKKKGKPAKAKSDDKTDKPFEGGDYTMRRLVGESLNPLLADALEKCRDKGKARAVCLTLMCAAEYIAEPLVGKNIGDDDFVPLLLELFTAADCDKQLRDKLVAELRRDFHLEPRESMELAKALGVDLLQLWKPTDELLQTLTDHGRELLAAATGSIPEFLLPFFGIEPKKPAKAKKAKAA